MTKPRDLANSVNSESIPASRIENNSIGASKLAPDSVDSSELATNAISANKVQDSAITPDKVADGAITPTKLSTGAPTWDANGNTTATSFRSSSGTTTAAAGVATTLFALPEGAATYLVTAMLANSGDAANYLALSAVGTVTGGSRVITAIRAGDLLTLSLSGGNVQATQSSGVSTTISWSFTRLANF